MSDYRPPQELFDLAARLCDGKLEEHQFESLRRMVAADRLAAAWLVDWMELNAMLHLDLGSQAEFPLVQSPLLSQGCACALGSTHAAASPLVLDRRLPLVDPSRFMRFGKAWLAVGASLLLALAYSLGVATPRFLHPASVDVTSIVPRPLKKTDAEQAIATIAGGVDAEFGGGVPLGARIGPGRLQLIRGVAQVVFDQGAVVVLEGPAELYLVDSGNCQLISGSISADVLPDAGNFRVGVGNLSIVESDARFGLRTAPSEATELHVFGGELNLVNFGGKAGQTRRLAEGEALRLHGTEMTTDIESDPASFVTRQELARRQRLNEQRAYARWVDYSKRWLNDPSVVLRYEFGPSPDGVIANTVDAGQHAAVYRRSTPRWIAGRWGNKPSMLFDGRTDVLDVTDRADLRLERKFSLAVWLQVRDYSQSQWSCWTRIVGKGHGASRNYGLWITQGGRMLWQVCPEEPPKSQAEWDRYSLEAGNIPAGQWHLVVGVLDEDELRVYVNGELRATGPAPAKIATSDDPLTIGYYGNVPYHNEYFCGEIDELILLNRVLADEEIVEMYEAGRPEYAPAPGSLDEDFFLEKDLRKSI